MFYTITSSSLVFFRRTPFGNKTTEFLKGTSLETTESQTQPDKLCERLENYAVVERRKEAVAVFEAVVDLSVISHAVGLDTRDLTMDLKVKKKSLKPLRNSWR